MSFRRKAESQNNTDVGLRDPASGRVTKQMNPGFREIFLLKANLLFRHSRDLVKSLKTLPALPSDSVSCLTR